MSTLLESRLTAEQREECARNDAALVASMFPLEKARSQQRHLFRVTVGPREDPRLDFSVMARDSFEAVDGCMCLAHDGERIEARPVHSKVPPLEPFSVIAGRQALECAQLRETAVESATEYAQRMARQSDRRALELQNGVGFGR